MSLVSNFRAWLYQRKLNQCLQKATKRTATNMERAKTIGIVFDATNEKDREIALSYKRTLQQQHKKVKAVAYYDSKEVLEENAFVCFCKKDIGFNQVPKTPAVNDFLAEPFDLLIGLHTHQCQPLEYIALASEAKFRIGHYFEDKTDFYDFMLYGKGKGLRAFTKLIDTYLQKVG